MKKFFLSIFIWIFLLWINFWYAQYKKWLEWKRIQEQARKNLKLLENTSWNCKKEIDSLKEFCEKKYTLLKGNKCLTKMLSDGIAWPVTFRVLNIEKKCASNSLVNTEVIRKGTETVVVTNRKTIVKNFCNKMSSYEILDSNLTWINAKNSVFLKILCNTTWIYKDNKFKEKLEIPDKEKKYYKKLKEDAQKDSLISFWLFWKCKNKDDILIDKPWLNNVNFVCVANDIWHKLANDEINLWSYIVYWWFTDEDWITKWGKDFFSGAKATNWKIICFDWYLTQDSDNDECKHPETYRMLKSTQWDLKQIVKTLNFFKDIESVKKIEEILLWKKCKGKECKFPLMILRDSIYNELYFYVYFLSYYWEKIKNNTSDLQWKKVWNNIKYVNMNTAKELMQAKKSITVARLSIKKSFDILKNIYWTYPIHVWFLAIIEDFKKLRDSLAPIYTPIDQLRYKLQNVQDKSKH